MNVFDILGIDKEEYIKVEEPKITSGFEVLDSGIYEGKIKELATYDTNSGARQLVIKIELDDINYELLDSVNIKKKDGTENKIGISKFKMLMNALSIDPSELNVEQGEIELYSSKKKATIFRNPNLGRKINILVRKYIDEDSDYPEGNIIEGYLPIEGKEEEKKNFLEKIEKKPILVKKGKNNPKSNETNTCNNPNKDIESRI